MKPSRLDRSLNQTKNLNSSIEDAINIKEPILCSHCLRTISNGIRCMGICVADNDY